MAGLTKFVGSNSLSYKTNNQNNYYIHSIYPLVRLIETCKDIVTGINVDEKQVLETKKKKTCETIGK